MRTRTRVRTRTPCPGTRRATALEFLNRVLPFDLTEWLQPDRSFLTGRVSGIPRGTDG